MRIAVLPSQSTRGAITIAGYRACERVRPVSERRSRQLHGRQAKKLKRSRSPIAQRIVRRHAIAPFRVLATVSAWQLEAIRRDALRRSPRFTDAAFLSAAIEAGAVPVPAIREDVLVRLHARNAPAGGQKAR